MSKRSKKVNELLNYLSEDERKVYEEFEAKLKGYVMYLKDHPDMFGSVLAVADEKGGVYRYLDLMTKQVQDEIENFTGSSAKELFMGALGRNYTVVSDK